jgi:hypothetical protein
MKPTRWLAIVAAVAVAVILCVVKVDSQPKIPREGTTEKSASAASPVSLAPPPEMEKLARALEGTWQVSEKLEPSDNLPKGGTGSGRAVYRRVAGGMSLMEEYRSTGTAGGFQGAALFWWDEQAKLYRAPWCDNVTGCTGAAGVGRWEGEDLVWVDEAEGGGKTTTIRETYTDIKSSSLTQILEVGPSGGKLKRRTTLHLTKLTR